MIIVENLSKSFNGRAVIKSFSHRFPEDRITFIIGASGSGKTTIVKCMVGLLRPDGGKVIYDGVDFYMVSRKKRMEIYRNMGFVFQGGALFDSLTVEENVMFPLKVLTDMGIKEMKERARWALERVGLADVGSKFPSELSGGMRKRAAIARGIVTNPRYFFFDEPTSGLDPDTSRKIDALIKELTTELKTSTIVISHDIRSVLEIADEVIFISKGEIEWVGTPQEMLQTDNLLLRGMIANALVAS